MSVKTERDEEAEASFVRVGSEQGVPVLLTDHLETGRCLTAFHSSCFINVE